MHYIKIEQGLWCAFCPNTLEISICSDDRREKQLKIKDTSRKDDVNHFDKELPVVLNRIFFGVSEVCNMSCEYCYASGGNYGYTDRIMSPQVAITVIDNYKSKFANHLNVVFFGGEPLLAQDTMRAIIAHFKELNYDVSYSIITNGTLIKNDTINFIKENNITLTISMDGPKAFHNHYRKFKDGTGSYDCIVNNMVAIKKAGLQATAEATCGPHFFESYVPGTYQFFRNTFKEIGFDDLHVGVAVKPNGYNYKAISGIQNFFSDMVDDAFDQLLSSNVMNALIARCFTETLLCLIKRTPLSRCGAGITSAYVSAKGDLYSCHLFHAAHSDRLNDANHTLPEKVKVKSIDEVEDCADCFCKNICLAWCPGISASMSRSEQSIIIERCIAQKAYTSQILKRFSTLYMDKDKWSLFSKNWYAFLTKKGSC